MLTRKHTHARDLLRRHRKSPFIFRQTSPISIIGETISNRETGAAVGRPKAAPWSLNRELWWDILCWSRSIRYDGLFTCPLP